MRRCSSLRGSNSFIREAVTWQLELIRVKRILILVLSEALFIIAWQQFFSKAVTWQLELIRVTRILFLDFLEALFIIAWQQFFSKAVTWQLELIRVTRILFLDFLEALFIIAWQQFFSNVNKFGNSFANEWYVKELPISTRLGYPSLHWRGTYFCAIGLSYCYLKELPIYCMWY